MNKKPKFIFATAVLFLFCLMSFTNSFAQDTAKTAAPNYKIYLDTIVATNDSGGNKKLSASLTNAIKDIKSDAFSDYYLFSSSFERIGSSSEINQRGIFNSIGKIGETNSPFFINWSLSGFTELSDGKGQNVTQFGVFRFDARVPFVSKTKFSEEKPSVPVVNYEQIGLNLGKFYVPQNVPTVIGSLSVSQSNDMFYFVLTVKPVE